jgi:hypothetical protein
MLLTQYCIPHCNIALKIDRQKVGNGAGQTSSANKRLLDIFNSEYFD